MSAEIVDGFDRTALSPVLVEFYGRMFRGDEWARALITHTSRFEVARDVHRRRPGQLWERLAEFGEARHG